VKTKFNTIYCFLISLLWIGPSSLTAVYAYPELQSQHDEGMYLSSGAGNEDVSDRLYYRKLRQLIGMAHETIDVSLDVIAVGDKRNDPVAVLLDDLVRAAKRGVYVRLFLNTFSAPTLEGTLFLRDDRLDSLRREGIRVHFVDPEYRFNDRLMIVDNELVLEGGVPWLKDTLERGFGSATLSYSRSLAQVKRLRLELLPLWDIAVQREERAVGRIPVPIYLLQDVQYFPAMVTHEDTDAMKVFFALYRMWHESHQAVLEVPLSDLTGEIPAGSRMEQGAVEYHVLLTIRRLSREYDLVRIEAEEPGKVRVRLKLPLSLEPSVGVPSPFFDEHYAKELTARAIYVYLVILYRVQASGESPVWLGSAHNVAQDFPISRENFYLGVDELRRFNLIEIYPFQLQHGAGYPMPRAPEYRYRVNPILTMSERLSFWSRYREQFGKDPFRKAKEMAEIFGEPEDPKVILTFIRFLEHYPSEEVRALTRHIAMLPKQSTPSQLEYLKTLLEHESQKTIQLATF